jgi:hypothetical protein
MAPGQIFSVLRAGCLILGAILPGLPVPAFGEDARAYQLESAEDVAYARKQILSQLAPLLPSVLQESGVPESQIGPLCQRFENKGMVNTHRGQIDHDYARAAEILSALPEEVREKFLRLSCQWVGPSALWRDEVAARLVLEPDQMRRIGEVQVEFLERLAPANRPDFSYGMTDAEEKAFRRRTTEIELERDQSLLEILTPIQRQGWQDWIGPESKALREFREYCARSETP